MLSEKQKELILELLHQEIEFLSKDYDGDSKEEQIYFIKSTIKKLE